MKKIILGRTGIEVTELCFGTLPIGPLQKNESVETAADVIAYALESGINFVDTAQVYRTYPQIKLAIEKSGIIPVISTKSSAKTYEEMEVAVQESLTEIGVSKIDIFLLHAARVNNNALDELDEPLQCLLDYKAKGLIGVVGISTHVVDVVKAAAKHPDIDIVFPLLNQLGMGILGGTKAQMEVAINECHKNNKGIFIMKALAGGNLSSSYKEAMDYITDFSQGRFACALGMLNQDEVTMNIQYFSNEVISHELSDKCINAKKFVIMPQCKKCGNCIKMCHSGAISMGETKAEIDALKCIKCGYCVSACPQFVIRMN